MKIAIIVIICILLVLLTALTLKLPELALSGKRQTLEEAMKWQSDHYDTSFYKDLIKTDYEVKGEGGYVLHIELLQNPNPTSGYMILSHGYSDNRIGSIKYVPMYLKLGFNCIIYDLRGHGENEPCFATCGLLEGQDLNMLIRDTRERYKDLTVLGLHGESLGAATSVSSLKYKPDVDFVVADCGFSDIENVLRGIYRSVHAPAFFFDLADAGSRIRYRYSLRKMRPADALDDNKIPILFIHGEDDTFILPENSKRMAERTIGYKELRLIPKATHATSILTEPALYEEYVKSFLKNTGIDR